MTLLDLNEDAACEPDRQIPCEGTVVLHFFTKDVSEAQVDNGQYGAGNLVVRGYFALSKRGNLGSLPPGATAIYLTAVPPQDVPNPGPHPTVHPRAVIVVSRACVTSNSARMFGRLPGHG